MEAKQSTLTNYYNARKKSIQTKLVQDKSVNENTVAKKLTKESKLTPIKSKTISRSKRYNPTRTSVVELLDTCNEQSTKLESPKSKNQIKPETPPFCNKTEDNRLICSPSKRKHTDSLSDQRTPESNNEFAVIKLTKSARKRLPLFDEKDKETEPIELPEGKTKDIESNIEEEKELEDSNSWELEFPLVSNIPRPISPLPETPQKLRRMRSQQMSVNSQTTESASNDSKELQKATDPGKTNPVRQLNLTPEQVKIDLMKCSKVEELKKQLLLIKQLKAATKSKEKPKSSSCKTQPEFEKEKSDLVNKTPAYKRFQHLTLPIPPTLTLPYSYTVLEEFFQRVDDVVRMLHNRSEVCTFSKLKDAVEKSLKRHFKQEILGQIKTVYPAAYEFKQEKGLPKLGYKYQGYQLTITPQFEESDPENGNLHLTATHFITRKKIFHANLVKCIMTLHKEFLKSLPKPMRISDDRLIRWHPKFRLDQVPDIEPSPLPQPPYIKVYQTAREVLNATRGKLHPKVESALINVSKANSSPNKPSTPKVESSIKGIPSGLLERIRAKETKRLEETITQSPLKAQREAMLKRLPTIFRIMRTYFITEKRTTLLSDVVVEKICESYTSSISKVDAEKHLELLLEVAPSWISMATTQNGKYLKLNRTVKQQDVQEKINLCCKKLALSISHF
ncbi:DNA replication factor Cdt1 isoform X2 [Octopus bimaculoides]|uniref:CDT1 Geminin-binding domain-containing protein n=1 Tax=Octopus bimaculoides TaxID=37653 RepID=A0A0L8FYW6_OCTBM|nr:DNA replication factor Cdt1 isoform X2 [Octopus bimaculoides]|eukprot:XP_014785897.1 PREDICTED: DNA replication factor Cdt1-like isoform X2 [Octopus bimaculoides]